MCFASLNLFFQNTEHRLMGLNSTYLCAFKNPRDLRQISTLGAKMIPGKGKFIVEAFQRATKNPWSYLFLDYNQDCPDIVRMRSNILPDEKILKMFSFSTKISITKHI